MLYAIKYKHIGQTTAVAIIKLASLIYTVSYEYYKI